MHTAAADADAIVRSWKTVENMSGSIMVRTMSLLAAGCLARL
jgi:hypothetical protein